LEGLAVKSRAPPKHYETPGETVNFVLQVRHEKHWGPNKTEGYLRDYTPERIIAESHRTIHRILVEARWNNPIEAGANVDSRDCTATIYGRETSN
jgi:hypothetical protein